MLNLAHGTISNGRCLVIRLPDSSFHDLDFGGGESLLSHRSASVQLAVTTRFTVNFFSKRKIQTKGIH